MAERAIKNPDAAILEPQHDRTRLLATAAGDPERPGKVISTETVVDRSTIDGSATHADHRGRVTVVSDPTAERYDLAGREGSSM